MWNSSFWSWAICLCLAPSSGKLTKANYWTVMLLTNCIFDWIGIIFDKQFNYSWKIVSNWEQTKKYNLDKIGDKYVNLFNSTEIVQLDLYGGLETIWV